MVRQKKIIILNQILTLLIVILAIIAYNVPRLSELLVYDRQAILDGEHWRLFSAPLVHFSTGHIFWDLLVFAAAGMAIHASGFRGFWWVCGFGTVLSGVVFLLSCPELERYGGLSGLATGAVAYFCLCNAQRSRKNRLIWQAMLLATGTKMIVEAAMGAPLFAHAESIPFRVMPSAHIVGFMGALITFIGTRNPRKNNDVIAKTPHSAALQSHR